MKILLIDCQAVGYRAHFSMPRLTLADNSPVGVIYGFFAMIGSVYAKTRAERVIFCWDNKHNLRKQMFPEYKGNRKKDDPSLKDAFYQFEQLQKEILPKLGWEDSFSYRGFESDDLIAKFCRVNKENEIIIVSSDNDLYQLLDSKTSMYRLNKKEIFTEDDFKNEYEIHPLEWRFVKAIAGCAGDNVPGIARVGEKTAIKYILGKGGGQHINTKEGHDIIKRNWPLVVLPLQYTPEIKPKYGLPSFDAWQSFCDAYEFKSFQKTQNLWSKVFSGQVVYGDWDQELYLSKKH